MAQEFTINSTTIEDKINQLLPSQGGFGAGIDFSASTMVIPIVDLTETAEGSGLRQDLQRSVSHNSATAFNVSNATTTIITTTGYFNIKGCFNYNGGSGARTGTIRLFDGSSNKDILVIRSLAGVSGVFSAYNFDYNVLLSAGDSVILISDNANSSFTGYSRQIASLDGTLVNPT